MKPSAEAVLRAKALKYSNIYLCRKPWLVQGGSKEKGREGKAGQIVKGLESQVGDCRL